MGDFSLTTFSQGGKLGQIENALKCVSLGAQCVGIRAKNGTVLACESKPPSKLAERDTCLKIGAINNNVGCVYSGLSTDYRVILKGLRKEAVRYELRLGSPMPTREVVKAAAELMQEFTHSAGVRPFGVSLLVAGPDSLWQVDPSGIYWAWKATSLGKRSEGARTFLERRFSEDVSIDDAVHTAIATLREGFDGQLNEDVIEIGLVQAGAGFRGLTAKEIRDYLTEV